MKSYLPRSSIGVLGNFIMHARIVTLLAFQLRRLGAGTAKGHIVRSSSGRPLHHSGREGECHYSGRLDSLETLLCSRITPGHGNVRRALSALS